MENDLAFVKAAIRSILFSLGRKVTVQEFLQEYKTTFGFNFKEVLDGMNMKLGEFLKSIPDVCHCWKSGDQIVIEQVSTAETKHMDHLTVVKKKKSK